MSLGLKSLKSSFDLTSYNNNFVTFQKKYNNPKITKILTIVKYLNTEIIHIKNNLKKPHIPRYQIGNIRFKTLLECYNYIKNKQ